MRGCFETPLSIDIVGKAGATWRFRKVGSFRSWCADHLCDWHHVDVVAGQIRWRDSVMQGNNVAH